jgi:hypothetical protein
MILWNEAFGCWKSVWLGSQSRIDSWIWKLAVGIDSSPGASSWRKYRLKPAAREWGWREMGDNPARTCARKQKNVLRFMRVTLMILPQQTRVKQNYMINSIKIKRPYWNRMSYAELIKKVQHFWTPRYTMFSQKMKITHMVEIIVAFIELWWC